MKKEFNFKLFLLLSVGTVCSLIYPLFHRYFIQTPPALPVFNDYEKVMFELLPRKITQVAGENHCKGYIIPLGSLENDCATLPAYVKDDINLAFSAYPGWHLTLDEHTKQEMFRRLDENLNQWKGVISSNQLMEMAKQQAETMLMTKYVIQAWVTCLEETEPAGIANIKLNVSVNRELVGTQLFSISVAFTHPESVRRIKASHVWKEKKIRISKTLAGASVKSALGFSVVLFAYAMVYTGRTATHLLVRQRKKKYLLRAIETREYLINQGHFVAALELVDNYLAYFPQDIEIKAFRERLLDITQNDPKKAQLAYLEAKKLHRRMENIKSNPYLSVLQENEKKELPVLEAYHPALQQTYRQAVLIEESQLKDLELSKQIKEIDNMYWEGWLNLAEKELATFPPRYRDQPAVQGLFNMIAGRKKKTEEKFSDVKKILRKGEVARAFFLLQEVLDEYKDLSEAVTLKNEIAQIRGETRFLLSPATTGPLIYLHFGDRFLIDREKNIESYHEEHHRSTGEAFVLSFRQTNLVIDNHTEKDRTPASAGLTAANNNEQNSRNRISALLNEKIDLYRNREGIITGALLRKNNDYFLLIASAIGVSFNNNLLLCSPLGTMLYYGEEFAVAVTEGAVSVLRPGMKIVIDSCSFIVELRQ